ncbi:family S53 protease [Auriscalpium vulgare]|uniref:Family S53 protease n=1 Tax=Auriscalpium vulgare TaxID=40419 RepID=A0ACB8S945_9AGAM|nr:family S53 protease [Auriscalpium vulgare]
MKITLVMIALLTSACATPHTRDMLVHERRDNVPHGYTHKGPAPSDQKLRLRLALTQTDIAGLHSALYAMSTPGSATYGQHLSKDDVTKYVAPKSESVDAIKSWLSENGLSATTLSPAGDWYGFETTVAKANELFHAEFSTFLHESGQEAIRTLSYSIPASLERHLDLVHPTVSFPDQRSNVPVVSAPLPLSARAPSNDPIPASCYQYLTPTCLQELYGIPSTPAIQDENQLGVTGLIQEYANRADLRSFLEKFRPDLSPNNTFSFQSIDGGENSQNISEAGAEADLDVQYTIGVASDVPVTFISVGSDFQDGDLDGSLDIVNFLLSQDNPPQVLSTSYAQDEYTLSRRLAEKLCNAYAQLGARGTSLLFGSGDGGVTGTQYQNKCKADKFVPTFPSSCPFVTSVGASELISPTEVAANFSSGGFSNYFDTPSYQTDAKKTYLDKLGKSLKGKYNATGRGYPDVSAIGYVQIFFQGEQGNVSGTSCSTPIFASVISLLNDRLIAGGKSPLGFLNPLLYSEAGVAALTDITSGNNPGCKTNGFSAVAGWDPITGLGTPIFSKMASALGL